MLRCLLAADERSIVDLLSRIDLVKWYQAIFTLARYGLISGRKRNRTALAELTARITVSGPSPSYLSFAGIASETSQSRYNLGNLSPIRSIGWFDSLYGAIHNDGSDSVLSYVMQGMLVGASDL
jgi:hypothetical protein